MFRRTLTHEEARRAYDRIGKWQDSQAFYEDVATRQVVSHGDFASAAAVYELGCGTGRFAEGLLREHLGPTTTYRAADLSPKMAGLARQRLVEFGRRVEILLTDGNPPTAEPTAAFDRFVSNFVFDLLSEAEIEAVLVEAHRILRPGGLLCLSSLSTGHNIVSRGLARFWTGVHRLSPWLVGGCRALSS